MNTFEPDWTIAPGDTIKEYMEYMNIPQQEFAIRLGISEQTLAEIYSGKQVITDDIAISLEKVTGKRAVFWNNLERIYREELLKTKQGSTS